MRVWKRFGWVGLLVVGAVGAAQVPEDPHGLKLSAATEARLTALGGLAELPAETWRVHDGDLAHGEAVGLDDAGWPEVKDGFVGTTGAMWFRRTIVVPERLNGYDLTGAKIRFAFDIWAEGPVPVIVYFDGRRVAMGEAMEPISLFERARPGDRIEVAVKALDTVDRKHFAGVHLAIDTVEGRPNPNTVRLEAVAAEYLVPALSKDTVGQQAVLEGAVGAVDTAALARGDQAGFDRSLGVAQGKLEGLRPLYAGTSFHLTGDAHIDAAWVWPWTETVDVVHRTFGTALQLMREYPGYTFSQSAAAYYAWVAEKYPWLNQDIKARVAEKRWEVVGGMWVEPDLNLPDGESLVRQLLVGTKFFREQYGVDVHVGWNPDSFGYNWQLPQIYKKSGIEYFVTQKMDWNETHRLPLKLFYWQSPDGSRVLTYFPHNYTNFTEPDRLAEDMNVARRENPGVPEMMHLYGIGDHGGGPTRSMLDVAEAWMKPGKVFPAEKYGTAETFFREMEPKLDAAHAPVWDYRTLAAGAKALAAGAGTLPEAVGGKVAIPVWNDELYLEYTRGVYTSQAAEKRNMRRSEVEMLDAEKWAALDWVRGAGYPAGELTEAWKKVLFNQFHDIAAGSSVGAVYKDAQRDYDDVRLVTAAVEQKAQGDLAGDIRTDAVAGAVPVVVWNGLGWRRTETVEAELLVPEVAASYRMVDERGEVVPASVVGEGTKRRVRFLARDVPSLGYKVFYAQAAVRGDVGEVVGGVRFRREGNAFVVENGLLRVKVDGETGCITSLVTVKTGAEAIAPGGCGNELQAFVDQPKDYDAWNIDPGTLDHPVGLGKPDSVALAWNGVRTVVRVTRKWRGSRIVQEIGLDAGADEVVVRSDVDWRERHTLLKAAFPLAASAPVATYEIPYGSIQRPTTRANSWEQAMFEVPALRWADLGDGTRGASLVNDSKYGYDAVGNVLRLSLLRSPTAPDAEADQGEQRFSYAIYPHTGDWKQAETVRRGYEFNDPLRAEQVMVHGGSLPTALSFVELEPRNLTLTAVKKTEDGEGLLLRFYDWSGTNGTATLRVPKAVKRARETNLMEVLGADLEFSGKEVKVPFTAFGITTVRVDF